MYIYFVPNTNRGNRYVFLKFLYIECFYVLKGYFVS